MVAQTPSEQRAGQIPLQVALEVHIVDTAESLRAGLAGAVALAGDSLPGPMVETVRAIQRDLKQESVPDDRLRDAAAMVSFVIDWSRSQRPSRLSQREALELMRTRDRLRESDPNGTAVSFLNTMLGPVEDPTSLQPAA